jgi:hypothetical protein
MAELVQIVGSPFTPDMKIVGKLVVELSAPYSRKDVTILISPNTQDFQDIFEQPWIRLRQVIHTIPNEQKQEVTLDFESNKTKVVHLENEKYQIELKKIRKKNIHSHDFPFFEFSVSKI